MAKKSTKGVWHRNVHPIVAWGIILFVAFFGLQSMKSQLFQSGNGSQGGVEGATNGFDEFGYNNGARVFNGPADGIDRVLDGNVWGDPTYANDKLVMKWNADWDRGNDESWANPPYNAWNDNQWNGKVKNGSGETWHYKIVWVGPCGAYGDPVEGGGYCIWGQFAVIMSQGTFDNTHIWDVLANPAGYGAYYSKP